MAPDDSMTTDEWTAAFIAEFRYERAAQGLTYAQLAERAGLKERTIMRRLTGKDRRQVLEVFEVAQIAKALGLSAEQLMERVHRRLELNAANADANPSVDG